MVKAHANVSKKAKHQHLTWNRKDAAKKAKAQAELHAFIQAEVGKAIGKSAAAASNNNNNNNNNNGQDVHMMTEADLDKFNYSTDDDDNNNKKPAAK